MHAFELSNTPSRLQDQSYCNFVRSQALVVFRFLDILHVKARIDPRDESVSDLASKGGLSAWEISGG